MRDGDASAQSSGEPAGCDERGAILFAALAAGIAHELNNLLTVIRGSLEPLQGEGSDPRTARRMVRAAQAVTRAAYLTGSLSAFARARRQDVPLDLNAALRSMRPPLERALGAGGTLTTEFAELPAPVLTDPAELRAALAQILLNCREAMPRGGRVVLRTLARQDAIGRAEVAISIEDAGCGMAPEVAARAMEPFFTTKAPDLGLGLGLAMANGFMKQGGGRLEVESREGEGTTVRLVFPLARQSATLPRGRAGETILIVETDADLRLQAASMLRGLGYEVEAVATADLALAWLSGGRRVDLLLTDSTALADRAREIAGALGVLVPSGAAARQPETALTRPFNLLALARAVRAALDAPAAQG